MSTKLEEIYKLYNYELYRVNVLGKDEMALLKQYEEQLKILQNSKN